MVDEEKTEELYGNGNMGSIPMFLTPLTIKIFPKTKMLKSWKPDPISISCWKGLIILFCFILCSFDKSLAQEPTEQKLVEKDNAVQADGINFVYPDVWGIELPLPEREIESIGSATLYEDEKGDIIIRYAVFWEKKHLVRYVSFFTGKIQHEYFYTSREDLEQETLDYKNSLKDIKELNTVEGTVSTYQLPDGSMYAIGEILPGARHPASGWFERYDKEGKRFFKKIVLMKSSKPFLRIIPTINSISDGSDNGESWINMTSLYMGRIWRLKDGTYIAGGGFPPFLIRFREDFTSPYIENSDSILMLDAEPYEELFEEFFIETLDEPFQAETLPSGEKIYKLRDNSKTRLEFFDKKVMQYFDQQMKIKKLNGGEL